MIQQTYHTPETLEEWQESADMAHTALSLDSARQYGLVTGGPHVNVERCEEILRLAADRGIEPHEDAVDRLLPAMMNG